MAVICGVWTRPKQRKWAEKNLRLKPYRNTPTLDIYFFEPLRDLIRPSGPRAVTRRTGHEQPIRRLGPNSFICNNRAVIIRYATAAELGQIRKMQPERCAYVIDDDFAVLEDDLSLPEDYRRRLMRFKQDILPAILALSGLVVAPNPLICKAYGDKTCELVHPSALSICTDFSHFGSGAGINLVFSGTRSHLADLAFIAPAIAQICAQYPHVTFTTFLGKYAPKCLMGQNNIIHRKPLTWNKFRQVLANERFHIALAPCLDTPFNRARSINKLLDHAAFGAAGIYSALPLFSQNVMTSKEGLLAGQQEQDWFCAMESLVNHPEKARQLAIAGARKAARLGNPARLRRFWRQYFVI